MDKHWLPKKTQELISAGQVDWQQVRKTLQETENLLDQQQPEIRQAVLQRRTEQIAQSPALHTPFDDSLSALVFRIGQERYAVSVTSIRAVAEIRHLTPIPCVPAYYRGVTNLGGKITSVLDLPLFFGIPETMVSTEKPTMVVVSDEELEIGLLVEDVEAVTRVPKANLVSAQSLGHEWLEAVSAVTTSGLIILDVPQLFRDPRIRIYEEPR